MPTAKRLTAETWADFEALFGKYHGVRGGCWCTYHQCASGDYKRLSKDERREFHRKRVLDGTATGLLLYDGDAAIGWCQFGRAEIFEQINRGRAYQQLAISDDLKPDWRITCLFIDRTYRRRGLSDLLLAETLSAIEGLGGGVVESFPFVLPDIDKPQYTGSVKMYERHGFEPVSMLGSITLLMRKCCDKCHEGS